MFQVRKADVTARVPPHVFFFVSAIFHYLGPAFAVLLFSSVPVLGVAWFRIASAAVVFAVWRRPWRIFVKLPWEKRRTLLALGVVLGLMNACFYLAISRIPLGTVGAIEFLGPITLAALGMRTPRNIFALLLAAGGGWLLTDVRFGGQPLGFVFAFANCAFFMLYVVLGHRIAQDGGAAGIDRLGAAMLIALVTITPIGLSGALPAMTRPLLLLAGIGVGDCRHSSGRRWGGAASGGLREKECEAQGRDPAPHTLSLFSETNLSDESHFLGIEHLASRFSLMKSCKFIAHWKKTVGAIVPYRRVACGDHTF